MKKRAVAMLILSALILSACGGKKEEVKEKEKIDVSLFEENDKKRSKYKGYTVEEVYLNGQKVKIDVQAHGDHYHIIYNGKKYSLDKDKYEELFNKDNKIVLESENIEKSLADISPDDIISYYKHGDHWHVKTKYGEFITHEDPSGIKNVSQLREHSIQTISKDELNSKTIVSYYRHGDHWHVKTSDGKEYVTYENPDGKKNIHDIKNKEKVEIIKKDNLFEKILEHNDHVHVWYKNKEYVISKKQYEDSVLKNKFNPTEDNHTVEVENLSNMKDIIFVDDEIFVIGHGDHGHEFSVNSLKLSTKPKEYIFNNNDIIGFNKKGHYVKAPTKLSNGKDIYIIYFVDGFPKGAINHIPSFMTWKLKDEILNSIIENKILEIKEINKGNHNVEKELETISKFSDKQKAIEELNKFFKKINLKKEDMLLELLNPTSSGISKAQCLNYLSNIKNKINKYPNLKSFAEKISNIEIGIIYDGVEKFDIDKINSIVSEINEFYFLNKEQIENNSKNSYKEYNKNQSKILNKINEMLEMIDKKDVTDGSNVNSIIFGIQESNRHIEFYKKLLNVKKLIESKEINNENDKKFTDVVSEYNEKINKYSKLQNDILTLKQRIRSEEKKLKLKDYYNFTIKIGNIYSDASGQNLPENFEKIKTDLDKLNKEFESAERIKDKEIDKKTEENIYPKNPPKDDSDLWNTGYDKKNKNNESKEKDTTGKENINSKDSTKNESDDPWNTGHNEKNKNDKLKNDHEVTKENTDSKKTSTDKKEKDDKEKNDKKVDDSDPWNTGF